MAERRSLFEIFGLNRNTQYKRNTGNSFIRGEQSFNNATFIQGYDTSAGDFDLKNLGSGESNSAVTSCLQVLGISFSEAVLEVCTKDDKGDKMTVPNHPLTLLMRRPNPYMSGDVIQNYIVNALHVHGNAYLLKQKNEAGELVSLYPLMPSSVTPKGSETELITHYEYETEQETFKIDNKEIVHFKLGLDPNNHKQGYSPLKTVLREIFGDESAGQMATALLSNMGVPSVMITPKDDFGLSEEEAKQIQMTYQQKVSGRNKGKPLVISGQMNVERLSFSPKDLDIGLLRRVPEERISAVLGVPAILAGLGAGLENATYSNARELREFFTENKLIPLWKMVAEELTQQILLPDYDVSNITYAEYNFSEVRALQTDHNDLFSRMNVGVQGGWVTVGEARSAVGLPTDESQNYYLQPLNVVKENQDGSEMETDVEEVVEQETPEAVTETEDDIENSAMSQKVIKKIEDQFCVIAEDSGKNMGCYPTRALAQRRLEQISRYSDNPKARVGKDTFTTVEEARKRAEEIGCNGTHTHKDDDGNMVYMPCATHNEYEQRLNGRES